MANNEEDKYLKYYVSDNFGSFDNPIHQSHLNSYGLCGRAFEMAYIMGFDQELRRVNTEIGTLNHDGHDCFHCLRYNQPDDPIDYIVKACVEHRDNPESPRTQKAHSDAKIEYGIEIEKRLADKSKAPVKQMQTDPKGTVTKAMNDGFEMMDAYCKHNEENDILIIDDVPISELNFKVQIDGLWYAGTIDQVRVTKKMKEKHGNSFSFEKFCDLRDKKQLELEILDAKTGIMVPGYFGLINSIQLPLYIMGVKYGKVRIGNRGYSLNILPVKSYIYHTRKLQTYKKAYTHKTKKNKDGSKMKFVKGDLKGNPVIIVHKNIEEVKNALENFPKRLTKIFEGIQKEVWTQNTMVCDSFCSVPKACVGEASMAIDEGVVGRAQDMAKELGL